MPAAQPDRHGGSRPTTSNASCGGLRSAPWCCSTRPTSNSCRRDTASTPTFLLRRFPNVVVVRTFSKAYGLAGMRTGYGICSPGMARTLWSMQLPFGATVTSLAAVAASFDAEAQLRHRIGLITAERDYLRSRLWDMGIWSADTHANFVYLPAKGQLWTEVFDGTGPRVRTYPDGSARITVGNRQSTQAVLATIAATLPTDAP